MSDSGLKVIQKWLQITNGLHLKVDELIFGFHIVCTFRGVQLHRLQDHEVVGVAGVVSTQNGGCAFTGCIEDEFNVVDGVVGNCLFFTFPSTNTIHMKRQLIQKLAEVIGDQWFAFIIGIEILYHESSPVSRWKIVQSQTAQNSAVKQWGGSRQ